MVSSPADLPDHLSSRLQEGRRLSGEGYRGRFAPSPTGELHLGNLSTALASWLDARCRGGVWLLRVDDLDTPRNRLHSVDFIQRDLRWLGLGWDGPVIFQSQRRGLYHSWLSWLRRTNALFACRCSRRNLSGSRIYPGTCRDRQLSWGWREQRLPSWRLRVPDGDPRESGDVVLRRADGFVAYQLATVIDELCFGITDVVRGADLREALPAQLSVFDALSAPPPRFPHVPLIFDASGHKLSKREGSAGLAPLREAGMDSAEVIGHLAAGLRLVQRGTRISADELAQHMKHKKLVACDS